MGGWTRNRTGWLVGMISLAAVNISVAIALDNMEFKVVGAFFAILGVVGAGIILFRWDKS